MHKENFCKPVLLFASFVRKTISDNLIFLIFQKVHDGSSTSAPKIAEICSSTHPPTIISEGNSLTLSLGETVENDYAFTFDLKASYSVIDSGMFLDTFCS